MKLQYFSRAFSKRPISYVAAILSLCVSFASFIVMYGYLCGELSYDSFHQKEGKSLYRVVNINSNSSKGAFAKNPPHLISEFEKVPEISSATRIFQYWRDPLINSGDKAFNEEKTLFVDPNFFEVFHFELIKGGQREALKSPNSALVNKAIATKYWGEDDPIGKVLEINQRTEVIVTGILDDSSLPSHLEFDMLIITDALPKLIFHDILESQRFHAFYTYIEVDRHITQKELEEKINLFVDNGQINYSRHLSLQRVDDIHLKSDVDGEISANSNPAKTRITIVLLVLVLALGFVNLSNFAVHELRSTTTDNKICLGGKRISIFD